MSYTATQYEDVEPAAPGMHFLRDALDCDTLGITVVEGEEDWVGMEHDHADEGHEEVYVLLSGSGQLTVEGEEIDLEPGTSVRVDPDASRQLVFHEESQMVIAGAP